MSSYRSSFRVDPKIIALTRSEIYGEPLQHLISLMREGEEPRKAVYLFTNAFMSSYRDGKLREYDREGDAEEIAWAEKAKFEEFRKEALRTIPGLIEQDLPKSKPVFYILRSRLRKELEKSASSTDRTSSLKDQLIKLGSTNPELRNHLRPILAAVDNRFLPTLFENSIFMLEQALKEANLFIRAGKGDSRNMSRLDTIEKLRDTLFSLLMSYESAYKKIQKSQVPDTANLHRIYALVRKQLQVAKDTFPYLSMGQESHLDSWKNLKSHLSAFHNEGSPSDVEDLLQR